MKVPREKLLQSLEWVSAGLAKKEIIEQSDCFVFYEGRVAAFNDEIAISAEAPLKVSGAVKAAPLLSILSKLAEETVDVEQNGGELLLRCGFRRSGVVMEEEVLLPVAEIEKPGKWANLPDAFTDAVKIVQGCAGKDESHFVLTCIHLAPDFLEACDNMQFARCPLKMPLDRGILLRKDSVKHAAELGMVEVSETENWVHFRNSSGLILSCRRYMDEYPTLDDLLHVTGEKTVLPGGLSDAVDKATVFSADNPESNLVEVQLKAGKMKLAGRGANGWYEEIKKVKYSGSAIKFFVDPARS